MLTPLDVLTRLARGGTLDAAHAEAVFEQLLDGHLDQAQIGALLALLQARGATVEEITGAARAMRRHVTPVPIDASWQGRLIDTCGTGGAPKTFNISTAAAIVSAAAGQGRLLVAKHGNRSRTGRGSAEVLASLGVNVDASPAVQARCLREASVCFCFAIHHHPAMRHAAAPRKSLGIPTIFNLLGPLTNPAGASRQVIGVYDRSLVEPMARTLHALGAARALVVHGLDGMDELSTTAPSLVAEVWPSGIRVYDLDPASLGLTRATLDNLTAADLAASAATVRGVIDGRQGPARDIVVLNAAAALVVGEIAANLEHGLDIARRAIDDGRAAHTLARLIATSHDRP